MNLHASRFSPRELRLIGSIEKYINVVENTGKVAKDRPLMGNDHTVRWRVVCYKEIWNGTVVTTGK